MVTASLPQFCCARESFRAPCKCKAKGTEWAAEGRVGILFMNSDIHSPLTFFSVSRQDGCISV